MAGLSLNPWRWGEGKEAHLSWVFEGKANGTGRNNENNGQWSDAETQFGKERYMELSFEHKNLRCLWTFKWTWRVGKSLHCRALEIYLEVTIYLINPYQTPVSARYEL